MAEGGKCEEVCLSGYNLSDTLLRQLSRRITDGTKLGDLGSFVLKLPDYETDGAEYNKPTIQEAALHILDKWRSAQNNRQEAFQELSRKLWNSDDFRTLAADLQQWAEDEQGTSGLTVNQPAMNSTDEVQSAVRQALIDRFDDYMRNDWLDDEDEGCRAMSVEVHYTEPEWTQTIKGQGLQDKQDPLPGGLCEALEVNKKVLVTGKPGTGKSSAVAKLALDWAKGGPFPKQQIILHKFNYMFVVTLRDVDTNESLEDIIMQQHKLGKRGIHRDEIKAILSTTNILVAFDGYDEYTKGINSDIDSVISNETGNFFFLITSRPGDYLSKKDTQGMTEVQIAGLSDENIEKCAQQYLSNDSNKAQKLASRAKESNIYGLLATPIVLLLVCIIFETNGFLPQTKTEIIQEIVNMLIERSTVKGKPTPRKLKKMQKTLRILGQLSWQALQKDTKQLYLDKSEVEKTNADILSLGLLHGSMMHEKSSRHKQPKWITFPHKLIQDFLAGLYVSKCTKKEVQTMFPSWKEIERQFEVVKFMCGLRDDPSDVVDHICQQFVEHRIQRMRSEPGVDVEQYQLVEIGRETKRKSVNPLCNDHIYYVQELPLIRQSKLYVFGKEIEDFRDEALESNIVTSASPTCAVCLIEPNLPHQDMFRAISDLNQPITDLWMWNLKVYEFPGPALKLSPEAKSVTLPGCDLPVGVQKDLGQQLSQCKELQVLVMTRMRHAAAEVIYNIGTKTNLTRLDLDRCFLSEEPFLVLCQQLQFIRDLKELNLSRNSIRSAGAIALGEVITSWGPNPPLEKLDLSHCKVDANGCVPLMTALSSCFQLQRLNLSDNPIGSSGASLLAETIKSWGPKPPLRELRLSDCNVDAAGCVPLMEALSSCFQLLRLKLSDNPVGSAGAKLLAEAITSFDKDPPLQQLNLSDCNVDAAGCVPLTKALSSCFQLFHLNLSENPLGSSGASLLAEAITSWGPNPQLLFLGLKKCDIDSEGCVSLMKSLQLCRQLYHLELDGNPLGSAGAKRLAEAITSWGAKPPLQILNLKSCNIDEAGCVALMKALWTCRNIYSLDMSSNPIGSIGAKLLAEAITSWGPNPPLRVLELK